MKHKYEISEQPNCRLREFPFYEIEPGSNEAFFVPGCDAGSNGQNIRYYAKIAGVKIKLRQRQKEGVMGYFVWVKSIEANRIIPPPPEIQHAAE